MAIVPICIDTEQYSVRLGVSDTLPHSVLLGTGVPGVFCHLSDDNTADASAVTRAQRRRQECEEALRLERQLEAEVRTQDLVLTANDFDELEDTASTSSKQDASPPEQAGDATLILIPYFLLLMTSSRADRIVRASLVQNAGIGTRPWMRSCHSWIHC